jgi:hypothetical protein
MGVVPGTTVGIGATEEEAVGSSKEAVVASISGWTIMLDGLSMNSDEYVVRRKAGRGETKERKSRSGGREKRREAAQAGRQRVKELVKLLGSYWCILCCGAGSQESVQHSTAPRHGPLPCSVSHLIEQLFVPITSPSSSSSWGAGKV